jgi:hypothetical protein
MFVKALERPCVTQIYPPVIVREFRKVQVKTIKVKQPLQQQHQEFN